MKTLLFLFFLSQRWSILNAAAEPRARERRHHAGARRHRAQDPRPLVATCRADQRHRGSRVCKSQWGVCGGQECTSTF